MDKCGSKATFNDVERACWPDPVGDTDWPVLDDVTRLNATEVERVFYPRSEDDIALIMETAVSKGKRISIRGTKHSMGGHTLTPGGFVIGSCFEAASHHFECCHFFLLQT